MYILIYYKHFTVSINSTVFHLLSRGKFLKTPWCIVSGGMIKTYNFAGFVNGFDIMVNWLPYRDIRVLMLTLCKTVKNLLIDL